MAEHYELFGHAILAHRQMSFEQQIRDVLVEEIQSGRWKQGEKLPEIIDLARESGFSITVMTGAFDALQHDGYVDRRGSRGNFVKSVVPGKRALGKVGILLRESQKDISAVAWYQHILLKAAEARNYTTEIAVIPDRSDPRQALVPGNIFNKRVKGVVSLTPFDAFHPFSETQEYLPYVFLCPPYEFCVPRVSVDVEFAYYELTSRMIEAGHRRIAFSYESNALDRRQAEMHLAGYRRAMAERRLPVNEDLIADSYNVNNDELVGVMNYVKNIMKMNDAVRPTALVCGSLDRAAVIADIAPVCHLFIPQELSIASIGTAALPGHFEKLMTGMLPDFDKLTKACFDVLEEYSEGGGFSKTGIMVSMNYIPGHTLMALDGSPFGEPISLQSMHDRYGIDSLSRAVHY